MGDEPKENELKRGHSDPLHAAREPSTAESVQEETPQVAEMPTREEGERRAGNGERR